MSSGVGVCWLQVAGRAGGACQNTFLIITKKASAGGRALMSRLLDPMHRGQIERLGVGSGARTLEVGCGNGSVSAWLAGRVAPGGRAVAVDLDLSLAVGDVPGLELRQARRLSGAS